MTAVANATAPSAMTDFHNCLTTLQLPHCAYSQERYSDMLILIYFRWLDDCARQLVAQTWRFRSQAVRTGLFLSENAAWYRQLNQLRMTAYGIGLDNWSISHCTTILQFPWALTDHEFMSAYRYVYTGQWPDNKAFDPLPLPKAAQDLGAMIFGKLSGETMKYIELGLATYGPKAVQCFFKLKNMKSGWVGLALFAADFMKQQASKQFDKYMLDYLKIRYEVDRVRRGPDCHV